MSIFCLVEFVVEEEVVCFKNGIIVFVFFGVQLLIFFIGFIIMSIWLVIGVVVYGMGIYVWYNFWEFYRRMVVKIQKGIMVCF